MALGVPVVASFIPSYEEVIQTELMALSVIVTLTGLMRYCL
jgi:hypothetical protein